MPYQCDAFLLDNLHSTLFAHAFDSLYIKLQCTGTLELNAVHRELHPATQCTVGLKALVLQYLHCQLIKTQQCSNW